MTPPKKLRRTSLGESPFSRVNSEVSQYFERRKPFLVKLEKHFEARVVSFFTSFTHLQAQITDDDAEMLESVLAAEHDGGKLVLVLNSPGGIALAAERIVNVCREYSKHNFEVVVPHMAKSAATMICFGASRIHMSRTAELGPVDPQRHCGCGVRQLRFHLQHDNYRDAASDWHPRRYQYGWAHAELRRENTLHGSNQSAVLRD